MSEAPILEVRGLGRGARACARSRAPTSTSARARSTACSAPTGAGKSTLIECVSGVVEPTPGVSASAIRVARLIVRGQAFEELTEPEVPSRITVPATTVTKDDVDDVMELGF